MPDDWMKGNVLVAWGWSNTIFINIKQVNIDYIWQCLRSSCTLQALLFGFFPRVTLIFSSPCDGCLGQRTTLHFCIHCYVSFFKKVTLCFLKYTEDRWHSAVSQRAATLQLNANFSILNCVFVSLLSCTVMTVANWINYKFQKQRADETAVK